MNAWQSIDFRESMNALICQKLLGLENGYTLPNVIWQNNQSEQTWEVLDNFGHDNGKNIQLGEAKASIANHYEEETFAKYGIRWAKSYRGCCTTRRLRAAPKRELR